MNGTTIQGLPQKSFRVESRNPAVKSRVMPQGSFGFAQDDGVDRS
jgi:hypothetical protein